MTGSTKARQHDRGHQTENPSHASSHEEDGIYELPAQDDWTKTRLTVYVVLPAHGQLYNGNGPLAGGDPNEVTPFENSYLRAMEDPIEEWNRGIRRFGSKALRHRFEADVYVLGRDELPDENKGPVLGFAMDADACIVNNSQMFVRSSLSRALLAVGLSCFDPRLQPPTRSRRLERGAAACSTR